MSEGFFAKLLKKGFDAGLDEKPSDREEFLIEIEKYCAKEDFKFEFIQRTKPAIISINDVTYKCELVQKGRAGWFLDFKEL